MDYRRIEGGHGCGHVLFNSCLHGLMLLSEPVLATDDAELGQRYVDRLIAVAGDDPPAESLPTLCWTLSCHADASRFSPVLDLLARCMASEAAPGGRWMRQVPAVDISPSLRRRKVIEDLSHCGALVAAKPIFAGTDPKLETGEHLLLRAIAQRAREIGATDELLALVDRTIDQGQQGLPVPVDVQQHDGLGVQPE